MQPSRPKASVALSAFMLDLMPGWSPEQVVRAPTELRIFKRGENESDQGVFVFDDEAAAMVMDRFAARGRDLVIDYEHMSMAKPPIKALAAGWFRLQVRDGELWAIGITWTDVARMEIEQKQYRYYSPAFEYEKAAPRRITEVYNCGLTNNPSLYSLPALVAATASFKQDDQPETEDAMDPKIQELTNQVAELTKQLAAKDTEIAGLKGAPALEGLKTEVATLRSQLSVKDTEIAGLKGTSAIATLASLMGLKPAATQDEIATAVTSLSSFRKEVLTIAGKDTDATAIGALTAMKEAATETATLRSKIAEVEQAALKAEFGAYLDGLTVKGLDGKFLPPAKRANAEKMALRFGGGQLTADGIAAAKEYLGDALVPMDPASGAQNQPGVTQPPTGAALSAADLQVAKQLGQDPKKLQEFITQQNAAGRQL